VLLLAFDTATAAITVGRASSRSFDLRKQPFSDSGAAAIGSVLAASARV